MEISVSLPDGSQRTIPGGSTGLDLARSIGSRLAKDAVAIEIDGHEYDLGYRLSEGDIVRIITTTTEEGRQVLRHSTAHVLAQAVTSLWPGTKFAIGPFIADGFYYDFDLPDGQRFSDEDLETIEARMREIIVEDQTFTREELSYEDGIELFSDQPYKVEIIERVRDTDEGIDDELALEISGAGAAVSAYRNSDSFVDLCRGPHVPSTGRLGYFKLTRVAGAYWRGDEHRPQLQRIYGTAFESAAALEKHLTQLVEAEKRDHRKLGSDLDLFHFPPEIGGGLPVFHPKGALIRQTMEDYSLDMHRSHGYQQVWTPHIAKSTLYEISGHLQWYKDGMYPPMEMEGATYYPKPMNCPMHILIYKDRQRSYRELPIRYFEFGTVYRFERSGVLHGLTRVRGITQDDSHIFCAPDQLAEELRSLLTFVLDVLRAFGLADFEAELATRPENFVGEEREWDDATDALRFALESSGLPYVVAEGEGAFYAPKIDVHLRDAIGRRWQLSTLQVDFQLPQLFDLAFIGQDGQRHRPNMIHRALFGSVERFFGILLEHYSGNLPTWLAPVQVRVLSVREDHDDYAREIKSKLAAKSIRVEFERADEPLGARVRRAKLDKIPYVLVVGQSDVENQTVGINARGSQDPERGVPVEEFVALIQDEIVLKSAPEFA